MTARPTLTVVLGCCLCLVSCAESGPSPGAEKAALEKTNWYVASKEPLTFCPKGYSLPKSERSYTVGEYVYLSDRKTRFFIPIGSDGARCRKEALAVRERSLSSKHRRQRATEQTVEWVGEALLRLVLQFPPVDGEGSSRPWYDAVWVP